MKWLLPSGALALYLLAVGCSVEPASPDVGEGQEALRPYGCCTSDAQCSRKLPRCIEGVCSEAPPPGDCWSDADCGAGETCNGASTCPCGAQCLVASHPGKCEPEYNPCAGLDWCDCIDNPECQAVTEPCFCPCGAYACAGNCACFCGGGAYLGCAPR